MSLKPQSTPIETLPHINVITSPIIFVFTLHIYGV